MSRVLFHQEVKKTKCLTSLFSSTQTFLRVPTRNLPAAIYGTRSLPLVCFTEDVWGENDGENGGSRANPRVQMQGVGPAGNRDSMS